MRAVSASLDLLPLLQSPKTRALATRMAEADMAGDHPNLRLDRQEARQLEPADYLQYLKIIGASPGRSAEATRPGPSPSAAKVLSKLESFRDSTILDAIAAHLEAHPKDAGALRKLFDSRGPMIPDGSELVLRKNPFGPGFEHYPHPLMMNVDQLHDIRTRTTSYLLGDQAAGQPKFPSKALGKKLVKALNEAHTSDAIRFSRWLVGDLRDTR